MANTKISALPAVTTPVAGTAQVPVVQGGVTKVATAADLRNTPEPFVMTAQATGSVSASDPNTIKMFSRSYAGRVLPEFMGSTGMDTFVQPALFNNYAFIWSPGTGTTFATSHTLFGGAVTQLSGNIVATSIASTNLQSSMRRVRYQTATTTGTTAGIRSTDALVWRGNAANLGGFFAFFRFSQSVNLASTQAFVGLSAATVGMTASGPGDLTNLIGIGYGTADAQATGWRLYRNDGTGTATAVNLTGAPRDTTTVLDLTLFCAPNSDNIVTRVYNQSTQSVVLDNEIYTTDIPTNTSMLLAHAQVRNGSGNSQPDLNLSRIYIESDI